MPRWVLLVLLLPSVRCGESTGSLSRTDDAEATDVLDRNLDGDRARLEVRGLFRSCQPAGCLTEGLLIEEDCWGTGTIPRSCDFEVLQYSNRQGFLIMAPFRRNDDRPDTLRRVRWTTPESGRRRFHICFDGWDTDLQSLIKAPFTSDPIDLESGCSGQPWEELRPIV